MTEEEKKEVATFRFGVICDLGNPFNRELGEQEQLIRDKCGRRWRIPFSEKTRIGRSTILRWMRRYRESNGRLESLYPRDRSDEGKSRAIDEETSLSLIRLRQEMPCAPVRKLIEEMNRRKLVTPGISLARSTVYRFLHKNKLMFPMKRGPEDRRKFEAELPNDLWQSDVMHGPVVEYEGRKRKSYLIAVIDDHSRLIAHGKFYLSESLASYLEALESAFLKRGIPRKLYVDNGAAFRSRHLQYITASLGIAFIHSKPYKPQGRGKIERWFKTVRSDFLVSFNAKKLLELNDALDHWITEDYHRRKHSSTGMSPLGRFVSKMECLRPAPKNLKDYFRMVARRKVTKDRTVSLHGRLYEAPVVLIGKTVELLYHPGEYKHIEVRYGKLSYGVLNPVDLHVNCRVKRDRKNNIKMEISKDTSRYRGGRLLTEQKGDKR